MEIKIKFSGKGEKERYTHIMQRLNGKESVSNAEAAGDSGLNPGWERSPERGHGNPL